MSNKIINIGYNPKRVKAIYDFHSLFMTRWILTEPPLSLSSFQTLTYLKLAMHIVSAIMIGLFFGDSGVNATKQISNVGMIMIHCVYLWYTTIMPGILRCEYSRNDSILQS